MVNDTFEKDAENVLFECLNKILMEGVGAI